MARYRDLLPLPADSVVLPDGGIETSLIYDQGLDLPDFAAFTLLDDEDGRRALERYFDDHLSVAVRERVGIVLETPTWRASPDWAARQGITVERLTDLNRAAVDLLVAARSRWETAATPVIISGCIGPRGDGYQAGERMTTAEARSYHSLQVGAFASSEADLVTAITMTYAAEATGVAEAAQRAGLPVVISFTVETDGRLPSGEGLDEAIAAVDDATGAYPRYYMLNCAHPTHFATVLEPGAPWTERLGGLRANASRLSHAELDEATELDAGDPEELAREYASCAGSIPSSASSVVVAGPTTSTSAPSPAPARTATPPAPRRRRRRALTPARRPMRQPSSTGTDRGPRTWPLAHVVGLVSSSR